MLFVVFDLESAFIFAWAVAARAAGWAGYIEYAVFIGVLMLTLVYLGRVGALDVASPAEKRASEKHWNESEIDERKPKAA
jgi:NADH-quinone oxidoreductase subunit A